MLPLPHGPAESVDEEKGRTGSHVQVCDSLVVNGGDVDRDSFERVEVRRNGRLGSAGGDE
jgi:hypothetical protein